MSDNPDDADPSEAPRRSSKAEATRKRILDLASEIFVSEGFAAASVRDLARRSGYSSGAIYNAFVDKTDLLVAAVDARITDDLWVLPDDITAQPLPEVVAYQFATYRNRARMRALLLEAAVAARGEDVAASRLHDMIEREISLSLTGLELWAREHDVDPQTVNALGALLWSLELGLGVLRALGATEPDPEALADLVRALFRGLTST